MDRTRSIRYAVLGLLHRADDALHGWAIRRQLQRLLGSFWHVGLPEVYRALDWLGADGLAERVESPPRFPMRKLFRVTTRGRDEFCRFLRQEVRHDLRALRQELSVRLLFGEPGKIDEQLVLVQRQRELYLGYLDSVHLHRRLRPPKWADESVRRLVIDGAEMQVRAQIAWLDRIAAKLGRGLGDRGTPAHVAAAGGQSTVGDEARTSSEHAPGNPQ